MVGLSDPERQALVFFEIIPGSSGNVSDIAYPVLDLPVKVVVGQAGA